MQECHSPNCITGQTDITVVQTLCDDQPFFIYLYFIFIFGRLDAENWLLRKRACQWIV